jgi:circadian clock protein KaiC
MARTTAGEDRARTGAPGLDDVMSGGFTRNHVYLLEGDPGTGKTTLALQFLMEGVREGERCLFITLSETKAELHKVAAGHGWSLDSIEIAEIIPVEAELKPEMQYTVFHPEEVELGQTTQLLMEEVERVQPSRLVIDSLAELRLLAEDTRRYRRQVLALKQYLTNRNLTVLLLDDRTSRTEDRQLHSVVHGVVTLDRLTRGYGRNRRRLEVAKLRGRAFQEGFHDYSIQQGGIVVFPRLVASQEQRSEGSRNIVSSGSEDLDRLLGGGLDHGSSALLVGPSGCGKSTLAVKYALSAIRNGSRVAMYSFDESVDSHLLRAASLGMPLREQAEQGTIRLEQVDPAELSPNEFAHRVRESVLRFGAGVVIIDSLNGYLAAMPEEQFLTLQMHELLTFLGQRGVLTIMILAQKGLFGSYDTAVDLSYLADTIVLLRFFEAAGQVRRAISVLKKRSSNHERTIREFVISHPHGLEVGPPLSEFRGVLSGIPEYVGATKFLKDGG